MLVFRGRTFLSAVLVTNTILHLTCFIAYLDSVEDHNSFTQLLINNLPSVWLRTFFIAMTQ
ncbi:hypothetical protein AOQ84DRAFT_353936 [Glonium stellatum]|uniref:Uncharacterized protein n=1 Tax=Glonium stellatum TaxID=574774 RepID=A0A8E2F3J3_9PEZI|nr:hypothetical protein AOQ84DRAFT_353936 [Glonium stellatum]